MRNPYDNISRVQQLNTPILVLHGDRDDIVPIDQGRKLYMAANDLKRLRIIEGAIHHNILEGDGELYWKEIESHIEAANSSR